MIPTKFKGWDEQSKTMHVPMTLQEMFEIGITSELPFMGLKFKLTFNSLIFLQFTGLLDKNKKEIYEGDILATSNDGKDESDVWTEDDWGYGVVTLHIISGLHVKNWASDLQDEESVFALRYVQVMGNIYQNPDLLK